MEWTFVLAIATIGLSFLTLMIAVIAGGQLYMFWWQLNIMRDGVVDAKQVAQAAKVTADVAKDSLRISQRAWVGIPRVNPIFEYPDGENLRGVYYSARLENSGVTPALKCTAQINSAQCEPAEVQTKQFEWPTLTRDHESIMTIFPRSAGGTTSVRVSIDEITRVFDGRTAFVLYVRCKYGDIFGEEHTTASCWVMDVLINPREVLQKNIEHMIVWRNVGRYDQSD